MTAADERTRPVVLVLATGGTIAGTGARGSDVTSYVPGQVAGEALVSAVSGIADGRIIACRQIANIGSEDMTEEIWLRLARAVREAEFDAGVDGVVILHGTDTMEETAFFLDLAAVSAKPVVLTGAMRPSDAVGADGPMNLLDAVCLAASPDARGRGALVVMDGHIHAAGEVTKRDTAGVGAFGGANGRALGRMLDGIPRFLRIPFRQRWRDVVFDVSVRSELPPVAILYGHAGQDGAVAEAVVATGVRGVVHAGVGMGEINHSVREVLAGAAAKGVVVVCSSRVGAGVVPVTARVRDGGFVAALDLNPQKARVLLQLALTTTSDAGAVQRIFNNRRAV